MIGTKRYWALTVLLGCTMAHAAEVRRPNLVFILADDCAHSSLGCYGGKNVATPNIDRLAQEGLKFNQAFVTMSMCVPFRAELYTGLYPYRSGCAWNHSATHPGTRSAPTWLSELGYRVGISGKRHFHPESNFPFETVAGFEKNCVAKINHYNPEKIVPFLTRNADQPFALYICSTHPHRPWTDGDPSQFNASELTLPAALADTPEIRSNLTQYLAEVAKLDEQVGDIMRLLKENGLDENTVVLFSSEQGWQFPGGKWNCWDLSLHTAFIARWPGHIQAGRETDALVQICDVLPTFVELAGGTPAAADFDGRSFMNVLLGMTDKHRDVVFGIHNNVPEGKPYPIRTVYDGTYRFIMNLDSELNYVGRYINGKKPSSWFASMEEAAAGGDTYAGKIVQRMVKRPPEELYCTISDPFELDNLALKPEYDAIRNRLRNTLLKWLDDEKDPGEMMDSYDALNANRKAVCMKPAQP
ncbi:MAG: sulfatase [Pontiellaceae bacterium]|nr:sulfatase [Pontiellaceae bacterium]MBN2785428.1 sulfatase [Pontiellaceae bacterium]